MRHMIAVVDSDVGLDRGFGIGRSAVISVSHLSPGAALG
jgi:hypothetical protein